MLDSVSRSREPGRSGSVGIRFERPDSDWLYEEPADAVRVHFDAWPLLERAGISLEQADQDPRVFLPVLEAALGEDANCELRSPGPHIGPDAGDWVNSFLDVVITTGGVLSAADIAGRIAGKLRSIGTGAYVSRGGIEALSRQQLRFRGHPEDAVLVTIELITVPNSSGLTGAPPVLEGWAAVFRLPDGRLVTMRWSLDGVLESYGEAV